MNSLVILITACGNAYMPGICKSIRENGERDIRIIGADMNEDDTILQICDMYYQVPRVGDPQYVEALLEICKKEHIDVLIPIMSDELEKLAENIDRFERIGIKVSISSLESLRVVNDKLSLLDYLDKEGLTCPRYMPVKSIDDVDRAIEEIGTPCVFKQNKGSGSRGMRIIDPSKSRYEVLFNEKPNSMYITAEELKEILREGEIPPMHAMEYLPGTEYTVDILADNGNVKYSLCRRGLKVQGSIMLDGITENKPEITGMCSEIVSRLKLNGTIGFDIKEREDGTPLIVECNPRATAGISEFTASGVNLLYLCIKMMLGEELPAITPEYGVVMRRRYMEMYSRKSCGKI